MRELTLGYIDYLLRKPFVKDKGLHNKYKLSIWKLKEVRAFLMGETAVEPKDPFFPLTQLPKDLLE